ncbi:uracil-DNA glycosylase family protein [Mitsuaria sp. BK037]|uniref:uracil-DNA glycosylase n=1 Tax=Mitsuaria sp. BK037 TaxID=2587122 RepID=UPI00161833DC|nr:uracil-DNA glycosylase [Mitsuaria sp. BK037]MBB3283289.1 DNA polymerase [Mitsuaria sp. BK037]
MSWTDRQRAMLEAMGLKLWTPPAAAEAGSPAKVAADATAAPAATAPPRAVPVSAPVAGPATRVPPMDAEVAVAVAEPPPRRAPEPSPRTAPVAAPVLAAAAADAALAQARGLARETIARLDWPGLRDEVAQCRACALCESRKHTVFGVGNERAHWMVVGEAPGEKEDLQGEPFVGAAGQLLDSMLRAVGLGRGEGPPERQVYIANTLKCRPPRNRNPDPAELAQCEPFLQRQIELIQPRIILAMGRFAVQQLLRSQEPIGRLRGRVHRYQGVPLIVTYHPAYLLRNLPDKARAWEDLCLALKTLDESPARPEAGGGSA